MPLGDLISRMADEVQESIEKKGVGFNTAFAWSAHRHEVRHGKNRSYYNFLFAQVRTRLSRRKNQLLRKSLRGEKPWQHGKIRRTPEAYPLAPPQQRGRLKPGIEVEVDENPYLPRPMRQLEFSL